MKTKLKDNIWIEGFNFFEGWAERMNVVDFDELRRDIIYSGRTSEIPEELAKECVQINGIPKGEEIEGEVLIDDFVSGYKNYSAIQGKLSLYEWHTAKESIQSACPKEYCVIYKTN